MLWALNSYGQNIKGTITDNLTKEPIPYMGIKNLSTQKLTQTNIFGHFELEATIGVDTILVVGLGYQQQKKVVSAVLQFTIKYYVVL